MNEPVIIIGAARSGTNMLRDLIAQLPGYGTWPCDEINYIWRHGNASFPTDEFNSGMATPKVKHFVRNAFKKITKKLNIANIVEKTCANSLRVSFISEIFPQAKIIFIYRNGLDVVASAKKRWTAKLDIPYLIKKVRYVPISDLAYYGANYFLNRINRIFSKENRLAVWGPKFDGMEKLLQKSTTEEICAIQWQHCVEKALQELKDINKNNVFFICYEDFVKDPKHGTTNLCHFLNADIPDLLLKKITSNIRTDSVGKWKNDINNDTVSSIELMASDTLSEILSMQKESN